MEDLGKDDKILKHNLQEADHKNLHGRQCTYKCNNEVHSHNHYCRGKSVSITHFVCVSVICL